MIGEMKVLQNDFFMDHNELQSSLRVVMLDCPTFLGAERDAGGQATPDFENSTVQSD